MDSSPSNRPGDGQAPGPDAPVGSQDPRRILLIELAHLLSLFFIHARHAKGARATAVLFDQIVGRLQILGKTPGHDGGLLLRRIAREMQDPGEPPDYLFLFGDLAFSGADARQLFGHHQSKSGHLFTALAQSFECFVDQGIYALYVQFPGDVPGHIDQLRLSLNIVARFRHAVENNASITFRYFGRAMTIPLIREPRGGPEPNLTMVAGLNGLSAVNMRELIKQAAAFGQLSDGRVGAESGLPNSYNQIFSVRGLRSQLIRPLVEVNNLPWMPMAQARQIRGGERDAAPVVGRSEGSEVPPAGKETTSASETLGVDGVLSPEDWSIYVDLTDNENTNAMETLLKHDTIPVSAGDLGRYISAATRLMKALEGHSGEPAPIHRLINFLYDRLSRLPDADLDRLEVHRQGVKIADDERNVLVGLVHPRLLDLIALAKDRIQTEKRIAAVRAYTGGVRGPADHALMDAFGLSSEEAEEILMLLKASFDGAGGFNRPGFSGKVKALTKVKTPFFEIMWCCLRQTDIAADRIAILQELPLLVHRLSDARGALGFLMADIFQTPHTVAVSDRNAFALVNLLLRTKLKSGDRKLQRTPEEVLSAYKNLDSRLVAYASWRLEIDQGRVWTKFRAIHAELESLVQRSAEAATASAAQLGFQLLLELEREGLIFLALSNSDVNMRIVREALAYYGNVHADIYPYAVRTGVLPDVIDQLQVILKAAGRLGGAQDLETFKRIEQAAPQLMALESDPIHTQRVRRLLQCIPPAIRKLQAQMR